MNRLIAVTPMAIFGAVWVNLGLQMAHASRTWAMPAAAAVALTLIVLAAWRDRSAGRQAPRPAVVRSLVWVGIGGEVVLIVAGLNILSAVHRMDLLAPVLAVIVGVHFLPLARAFSAPIYVRTGLALIAVGLVGFVLQGEVRPLAVGLGAALALWLTCVVLLARRRPGVVQR